MNAKTVSKMPKVPPRLECFNPLLTTSERLHLPELREKESHENTGTTEAEIRLVKRLISGILITIIVLWNIIASYDFRGYFAVGGEVFIITAAAVFIPMLVDKVEGRICKHGGVHPGKQRF